MSEELNQPTQQQPTNGGSPKRRNLTIYLIIIVVLLGTNIYLLFKKNQLTQQNQQTSVQLDSVTLDRNKLDDQFKAAAVQLDAMTTKNAELDSQLHGKDGEIARLKSQISGILSNSHATQNDLKKARQLINTLNGKVRSYEEQIAELEHKNTELTGQNQVLTKERDSTVQSNIDLKNKGSVLHASNIRLTPIHLKHGGKKEKETGRARKVDVMRITFDIDENRIAESGTKQLFIRILGPDGGLITSKEAGSGTLNTADSKSIDYSILKEIALQQNQPVKDVIVDWQQAGDYQKGTYNIEIYNGGYKVGNGSVSLK